VGGEEGDSCPGTATAHTSINGVGNMTPIKISGFNVSAHSAYVAGYNACLADIKATSTELTYYTGGTYYKTLYVAPTGGATPVNDCRAGMTENKIMTYTLPSNK